VTNFNISEYADEDMAAPLDGGAALEDGGAGGGAIVGDAGAGASADASLFEDFLCAPMASGGDDGSHGAGGGSAFGGFAPAAQPGAAAQARSSGMFEGGGGEAMACDPMQMHDFAPFSLGAGAGWGFAP
jgi:hypothetical protein